MSHPFEQQGLTITANQFGNINVATRLNGRENTRELVDKMTDGHVPAAAPLLQLLAHARKIDPDAHLNGLGLIMLLDCYGIYGSSLHALWSRQCRHDLRRFILLIRSVQLGVLPLARLQQLAYRNTTGYEDVLAEVEWNELDKKVCERLDNFQRPPTHSQEAHHGQQQETATPNGGQPASQEGAAEHRESDRGAGQ